MAMADIDHLPSPGATTKFGKKKKTGVLYVGQHAVLKPVNNCISGRREVDFYNSVFQQNCDGDDNDDVAALRDFLPRYLGVEERGGVRHIKLENTLSGFRKPCTIDIKMGHVTSDPLAMPEKVAHRRSKYPYAEKLGFTLSGMTVYIPERSEFEKIDKSTCHRFTVNQVIVEGLGKFFGFPTSPRKDVILCLLHKLKAIRRWFLRQRQFVFFASSLFIVYEGMVQDGDHKPSTGCERVHCCCCTSNRCQQCSKHNEPLCKECGILSDCSEDNSQSDTHSEHPLGNTCSCRSMGDTTHGPSLFGGQLPNVPLSDPTRCRCVDESIGSDCSLVDVRLIDFTHAFQATERDDNYLSGLEILIKILHVMYSWG